MNTLLYFLLSSISFQAHWELNQNTFKNVEWESRNHEHLYKDEQVKTKVLSLVSTLIDTPGQFEKEISELPESLRKAWARDSLDTRTDPIDILASELKKEIFKYWIPFAGSKFQLERSELWSLSKHRLKKLLDPAWNKGTGVSVVRKAIVYSREVILACAAGNADFKNPAEHIQKELSIGGLSFQLIKVPFRTPSLWRCGARTFKILAEPFIKPPKLTVNRELPSFGNRLEILVQMGLEETVKKKTLDATTRYLSWRGGFKLVDTRPIDQKERIKNLFPLSHIFISLIDLPQANLFNFSMKAEQGTELIFEKKITRPREEGDLTLVMHVILPPIRTEEALNRVADQKGTPFTQKEVSQLFQQRRKATQTPLIILDLACFSIKNIKRWMAAYAKSVESNGKENTPIYFASLEGRPAESKIEIISQMELVLSFIDAISEGKSTDNLLELLTEGSFVNGLLNTVSTPFRWLGAKADLTVSFHPKLNSMPPFDQLYNWRGLSMISLSEQKKSPEERQLYAPIPG